MSEEFHHPTWEGRPAQYQEAARVAWSAATERSILPWTWIIPTCEVERCLNPGHMLLHSPVKIAYPAGICIYCGESATGVDHLLPKPWTGMALRPRVAVVPACKNCNGRIGDFPNPSVAARRKRAQLSIERSSKAILLRGHRGPSEMASLGYAMRSVTQANNAKYAKAKARLGWPDDPVYDIRAFQKSGIEDPVGMGLCEPSATALRPEYREAS